jgi:CHASE3 domain sensor protein
MNEHGKGSPDRKSVRSYVLTRDLDYLDKYNNMEKTKENKKTCANLPNAKADISLS